MRARAFFEALSARGDDLLWLDEKNAGTPGEWTVDAHLRAHAVFLGRGNRFRTVALDFDAKRQPEAVAVRDASIALDLLDSAGVGAVMTQSGPGGGRHVLFTVSGWGLPARSAKRLVDRLEALGLASLDISNMSNRGWGAIRPPLARHTQSQARSRVVGDEATALAVLRDGNAASRVELLIDSLAGPDDRWVALRDPNPDRAVAPQAKTYDDRSDHLQALATSAVNARKSLAEFEAQIRDLDPRHPVRLHLADRGRQAGYAVRRSYSRATDFAQESPARGNGAVNDEDVLAGWNGVVVGRLPGGQGRVALALRAEASRRGRRLVGASVRTVAEWSGLSKAQAARVLKDLLGEGVLELADSGRMARAARYRLVPVIQWSAAVSETVGPYPFGYKGGERLPTVSGTTDGLALAETPAARIWDDRALGEPRRRVYQELVLLDLASSGDGVPVDHVASAVGKAPRTIRNDLMKLAASGLAERAGIGVWRHLCRDEADLAFDSGVEAIAHERRERHGSERLDDRVRRTKARLAARGAVAYEEPLPIENWPGWACSAFSVRGRAKPVRTA